VCYEKCQELLPGSKTLVGRCKIEIERYISLGVVTLSLVLEASTHFLKGFQLDRVRLAKSLWPNHEFSLVLHQKKLYKSFQLCPVYVQFQHLAEVKDFEVQCNQ
jgi:hypothetical protein